MAHRRELELGRSTVGRPILALHFLPPDYAKPKPPAVLLGALAGDEPLGVHCLAKLAEDLVAMPPGRDTWIIPALNVDGLAGGSKNNANDVDLDRNFAASNWSAAHKPGYRPGSAPESEVETQILSKLIDHIGATRLVVVRSAHRLVHWAGSGKPLAEEMAALNGYGVTPDDPAPGALGSKYGRDRGFEVVSLEIPFVTEADAWQQNRAALRHVLDLPPGLTSS